MKKIRLTQGKYAFVDGKDFEILNKYKWCFGNGYAYNGSLKKKIVSMHGFLLGDAKKGYEIDHINGNKLDNRRSNLRFCTRAENVWNTEKPSTNTSGFKGVSWYSSRNLWRAYIAKSQKFLHIGYFKDVISAVRAYNIKAKELYGDFARLNKI